MEKLFIIKIGGNIIDSAEALGMFLADFAKAGGKKMLVHGGGKIASRIGEKLGVVSEYVNGRRITDAQTIDLVTMVYGGLVNKQIVAKLQSLGCNAIGVTGADADILPAVKRPVKEIDYGFAGDIASSRLSTAAIRLFLENGLVPVVAPLTHDGRGQILNTNADTIASVLAVALSKDYEVRLIYCFEKKGVLRDIHREDSVIHDMDSRAYRELLSSGALAEGILPKLENAFDAIGQGVKEVLIGHAADILKNTGREVSGTLIKE